LWSGHNTAILTDEACVFAADREDVTKASTFVTG